MRPIFLSFLLTVSLAGIGQPFSKFFSFGASNPYSNTSFLNCHELNDSSGYLIITDRYTTTRSAMLIRTDPFVNEIWSVALNFQTTPAPFDNISFTQVGELTRDRYFVFGATGPINHPSYVIFVFDTSGAVVNYKSFSDTLNASSIGNYAELRIGCDSSVIIAFSEYERYGFYRLDTSLNLLSSGFFMHPTNVTNDWGRDCIMVHDSSMVITSGSCLTHTTTNGNVLWAKEYSFGNHFSAVYESPTGMLYAGGTGTGGLSTATLVKTDGNGNPLLAREYTMQPYHGASGFWNIYPCDNHLMLYCDSVMIVVDTNGNVIGWGKTVDAYNTKFVNPTNSDDFLLTGKIFQDSMAAYEFTLMKFDDSTEMGCLHPRIVTTNSVAVNAYPFSPVVVTPGILRDTFPFTTNPVNIAYDPLNGCPPGPLGIEESTSEPALQVFPSPASSFVTITTAQPFVDFEIYDVTGKLVCHSTTNAYGEFSLEVSGWSTGVYVLAAHDKQDVQRLMFVVSGTEQN